MHTRVSRKDRGLVHQGTLSLCAGLTLVEHPNLPARCWFRYSMPVVIHQDPLVFGLSTKVDAELLGLFDGWVQVLAHYRKNRNVSDRGYTDDDAMSWKTSYLLVPDFRTERLELLLDIYPAITPAGST
jgi:hypothetical protein